MNYTIHLSDFTHLPQVKVLSKSWVLVGIKTFSKFGQIKNSDLPEVIEKLRQFNVQICLDFSVLVKDLELKEKLNELKPYLDLVDRVRCSDPGVALALAKEKNIDLELSLEQAAPNQVVAQAWAKKLGPNLKKLILSNQFPISEIEQLNKKLNNSGQNIELELLALGPIETFYSRRKLIAKPMGLKNQEINTTAYSDDRPNQVGRLKQNDHGTFYFHDKDLCLIGLEEEAEKGGVTHFRLDPQNNSEYQLIADHFMGSHLNPDLVKAWPQKTTIGFFHKNRTDKPLKRLTNNSLQKNANLAIGKVIESKKNSFMVIELFSELTQPCNLTIINPEGKGFGFTLKNAKFLNGQDTDEVLQSGIYLLKWVKYALVQSLILPNHD